MSITKNKLRFYYFLWDICLAGFENVGICLGGPGFITCTVNAISQSLQQGPQVLLLWSAMFRSVHGVPGFYMFFGHEALSTGSFVLSQSLKSGDSSQRLFPLPCFTLWSPSRSFLSIVTDASGTQPSLCKEIV